MADQSLPNLTGYNFTPVEGKPNTYAVSREDGNPVYKHLAGYANRELRKNDFGNAIDNGKIYFEKQGDGSIHFVFYPKEFLQNQLEKLNSDVFPAISNKIKEIEKAMKTSLEQYRDPHHTFANSAEPSAPRFAGITQPSARTLG